MTNYYKLLLLLKSQKNGEKNVHVSKEEETIAEVEVVAD